MKIGNTNQKSVSYNYIKFWSNRLNDGLSDQMLVSQTKRWFHTLQVVLIDQMSVSQTVCTFLRSYSLRQNVGAKIQKPNFGICDQMLAQKYNRPLLDFVIKYWPQNTKAQCWSLWSNTGGKMQKANVDLCDQMLTSKCKSRTALEIWPQNSKTFVIK